MRSMELSAFFRAVIMGSVCLTLTHPRMWSQAASDFSVHVEGGNMTVKPGGNIQLNCIGSRKNFSDYLAHRVTWTVKYIGDTVRKISEGFSLSGAKHVRGKYGLVYEPGEGGMHFRITIKGVKYHDSGVYTCSLYRDGEDVKPISSSKMTLSVVRPIEEMTLDVYDEKRTVAKIKSSTKDGSVVVAPSKFYQVGCRADGSNVVVPMRLLYNGEETSVTRSYTIQHYSLYRLDRYMYKNSIQVFGVQLQAMDVEQTLTCEARYPGDVYPVKTIELKLRTQELAVDGSWAMWSALSECDVTCGSGHMTRTRTCTDPAPAHGGLDCAGEATDIQNCTQKKCPQSDPHAHFYRHFPEQYNVHGVWTDWGSWSGCSETCGLGLLVRQRSCSNPEPSSGGEPCDGFPVDYKPCVVQGCRDGHWSEWEPWTSCTGSSIRSRTRQCDNPAPSWYGTACAGKGLEYADCPRQAVAFSVTRPNGTLVNDRPVFTEVITNVGEGFNEVTGEFTCHVPGLYSFSATLWVIEPSQYVHCSLCKNGAEIPFFVQGRSSDGYDSGAVQIYLQLSVDDTIGICACANWENVHADIGTYFSGALVSPASI